MMSLANNLCLVLCACTTCAAAFDVNVLVPAESLIPASVIAKSQLRKRVGITC